MTDEEKVDHLRDAVKQLLETAELNQDSLEPETTQAIEYAALVLEFTRNE